MDWRGQKHHHPISGYPFHMGAEAISWSSKKQNVVVLSSTMVKYIMQTHMANEGLWWYSFLWELHSVPNDPLTINCDNQGTIAFIKDNKFYMHTKPSTCTTTSFMKLLRTERSWSITFQQETTFLTFLPSLLLSYWGCMQSHTKCKNYMQLTLRMVQFTFCYHIQTFYVMCDLTSCATLLFCLIFLYEAETLTSSQLQIEFKNLVPCILYKCIGLPSAIALLLYCLIYCYHLQSIFHKQLNVEK